MTSQLRRFRALKARAADQAGTPEGELCDRLVAEMCAKFPLLLQEDEDDGRELPTKLVEIRWKQEHERNLLERIGRYFGIPPQFYAGRPRLKVVVFDVDEPTEHLIRSAYTHLCPKLEEVIWWSQIGFFSGALPLPRKHTSADGPTLDPMLAQMAMAASRFGKDERPDSRKALPCSTQSPKPSEKPGGKNPV